MRANVFLLSLVALGLSACASNRPVASSQLEFLGAADNSTDGPDYTVVQKDVERHIRWDDVYVQATPDTPVVTRSLLRKGVEMKAFKEKWPEEKVGKAHAVNDFLLAKAGTRDTCFYIKIEARDKAARENKAWHFTLHAGGKTYSAQPKDFSGHKTVYTTLHTSRVSSYAVESTVYDFTTSVCFDVVIDFKKPFDLEIEPRFKPGIRPAVLRWLEPKS